MYGRGRKYSSGWKTEKNMKNGWDQIIGAKKREKREKRNAMRKRERERKKGGKGML